MADKTLEKVLGGRQDANVSFADLCALLRRLGFVERIVGSHHLYSYQGLARPLNLQKEGAKSKPYQVRQVRQTLLALGLGG
jgi:hypothetical protein